MFAFDSSIMRGLVLLFACNGAACNSAEDNEHASRVQCQRLRDHIVELRLANAKDIDVAAHRRAMQQALGDDFLDDCAVSLDARYISCALGVANSDALGSC